MAVVNVREASCTDVSGIARVHVESWRTTYPGIIPAATIAEQTIERREAMWRQVLCGDGSPTFVYVALDRTGEIVGFTSGGPERTGDPEHRGELYALYLLASHQRCGIGRDLVAVVRGRLQALGFPAMLIWVAAENHSARRFYEAAGGRLLRSRTERIADTPLDEVAYGWPAVASAVAQSR